MTELPRLHVIPGGRADQPAAQPAKSKQRANVEQPAGKQAPKASPLEPTKQPAPPTPEPLWREVLGDQLRDLRRRHQESLAETAARAGISPQYLSELERGLKEPSSEMIAAVAGALGTTLGDLTESVATALRTHREPTAPASRHETPTRHEATTHEQALHLELAALREQAAKRELTMREQAARRRASGPVLLALAA